MSTILAVSQMLPSQSKRKVPDNNNPLVNAAKRAKREGKASDASNKRKLLNTEEQPGGLRIIRAPHLPPSSQPQAHSQSQQEAVIPTAAPPTITKPPSKKFRAGSSQPSSSKQHIEDSLLDHQIEDDVRAMEDEADHLRRNSRAHITIDPSLIAASPLPHPVRSSLNPGFQFPMNPPTTSTAKARVNGSRTNKTQARSKETITDTIVPLQMEETPQILRNKRLRESAMSALGYGHTTAPSDAGKGGHHRRKSSIGRGKRISSSFASTGAITLPHGTVSDSSFYKHIDTDLPDPERMRQLLIWCTSRAASSLVPPSTLASSSTLIPTQPPPSLPPLSEPAIKVFKLLGDDLVRMLAERQIDLSMFGPDSEPTAEAAAQVQTENAQNIANREREITYSSQIQRAMAEEEAWKKVEYEYEVYARNMRSAAEKRHASLVASKHTEGDPPQTPSAKARGKQRAFTNDVQWRPREHELPPSFRAGASLARSLLDRADTGTEHAGPSQVQALPDDPEMGTRVGIGTENRIRDREAELMRRITEVEYKVDFVWHRASTVRTMAEVAEKMLDVRFAALARRLELRSAGAALAGGVVGEGGTDVLRTYVHEAGAGDVPGHDHDPVELLRALTRVDEARPPAMVGDAVRRAAREVQRVEESGGIGVVGERRLTGVPATGPGMTPRKTPGTPRRGTTPGRERER